MSTVSACSADKVGFTGTQHIHFYVTKAIDQLTAQSTGYMATRVVIVSHNVSDRPAQAHTYKRNENEQYVC
jgi:hypothetical protein